MISINHNSDEIGISGWLFACRKEIIRDRLMYLLKTDTKLFKQC